MLNTSSSVFREQQTTPIYVYNTWRSDRAEQAMKPDISRKSLFLPTPPAFDARVGNHRPIIAMTYWRLVW